MSKEILVNQEAFVNAINSISTIVGNLESITTSITNANTELKDTWKSKSSKAFFSESENIANTFTDYTEGLVSLCEDLSTVLIEFTDKDQSLSKDIGGK